MNQALPIKPNYVDGLDSVVQFTLSKKLSVLGILANCIKSLTLHQSFLLSTQVVKVDI